MSKTEQEFAERPVAEAPEGRDDAVEDLLFKQRDADSYNAVVERFDHFSQRFTAEIPDRMIKLADLPKRGTVLDLGAGSGIVAAKVAKNYGSGLRTAAADLSQGMLSFARQRALKSTDQGTVDFLRMDAENLAFRDGAFDVVLSLYALPHFPRPDCALSEMYRVLKPGGTLVVGIGSPPPLLSIAGARAVLRKLTSLVRSAQGRELRACEFLDSLVKEYVPEHGERELTSWSRRQLGSGTLRGLVRAAGFSRIRTAWAGQYSVINSSEEFYQLQMTFSSLARKRLANADPVVVRKLRARFDECTDTVKKRKGRLVYQSGALLISATKSRQ